jgi:predicted type IV restriction endonuclease
MDLIDEIRAFAKTIPAIVERNLGEEGTKMSLVMPFIRILGYDVFNPNEVNPEYIADVGTKKGEKVDYAIMKDGSPVILIECKPVNADLSKEHASQLFRYFTTTASKKVGVLTNGVIYQFFTDLDDKNKMDNKPFLEINLLDLKDPLIKELKKFTKQGLDLNQLDSTAEQLRYTREIVLILDKEFSKPSPEFIEFFARQVSTKKLTQQVKEKFGSITKDALNQFLNDKITSRLQSAMETKQPEPEAPVAPSEPEIDIVTTPDEWQAYYMVQAILSEIIEPKRVDIRDARSYCAVLLDNNNRKSICRFYFNTKQYYLAVFDNPNKTETKIPISSLNEIFKLADHLKNVVAMYDAEKK